MRIIEYRIPLPLQVAEYQRGQLYMIAKFSRENSKGGEWVDILVNEPFADERGKGQYTHKVIHLDQRIPYWIACLLPASALELHEKAWNAYPYSKTEYSVPFLGERFTMTLETKYEEGEPDLIPNALNLNDADLAMREVVLMNIRDDPVPPEKYKLEEDPGKYHSEVTGRGPLQADWMSTSNPIMTCYKLLRINISWWGIQTKAEDFVVTMLREVMLIGHRQVFCWLDQWHGMSMDDIRAYEEVTKIMMEQIRLEEEEKKKLAAAPVEQKSGWLW